MRTNQKNNEYSTPYLTSEMIEAQAMQDLLSFQRITRKTLSFPIFADEILESLWGVSVDYQDDVKDGNGVSVLACFVSEKKIVYVNEKMRGPEGRASFTLAHEAGHVSLHNFLSVLKMTDALCRGSMPNEEKAKMIERQADKYASALLMPKEELMTKLNECEYSSIGEINLQKYSQKLTSYFGVSNQALEMRLSDIGITTVGGLYEMKLKKIPDKYFEEKEAERMEWSYGKQGRA